MFPLLFYFHVCAETLPDVQCIIHAVVQNLSLDITTLSGNQAKEEDKKLYIQAVHATLDEAKKLHVRYKYHTYLYGVLFFTNSIIKNIIGTNLTFYFL